jgi:hypothetical protein
MSELPSRPAASSANANVSTGCRPWWVRVLLTAVSGAFIGFAVLGVHKRSKRSEVDRSAGLLAGDLEAIALVILVGSLFGCAGDSPGDSVLSASPVASVPRSQDEPLFATRTGSRFLARAQYRSSLQMARAHRPRIYLATYVHPMDERVGGALGLGGVAVAPADSPPSAPQQETEAQEGRTALSQVGP